VTILETIIAQKRVEVEKIKSAVSIAQLERSAFFQRQSLSLKASLLDPSGTGIIAEFKRRSPSKGIINAGASVEEVTRAYVRYGASGLSVLTDTEFFGGSAEDLVKARANELPLLRKDFMIDEYQVIEAKSMGADVILLIAACLKPAEVMRLAGFAKSLGLEVLLELHASEELDHICPDTELVGINNRDLKTFRVDPERSLRMAEQIPADKIKIAESGISSVENITLFKHHGFRGFLVGEHFMKEPDPAIAFARFVDQLNTKAS
jgi:indole-3-glycerol phosphate synthase